LAIDNAGFISELTLTIPLNTEARAEGAAQIRSAKRAVQQSFPNIDNEVTADAATMNAVFDDVFLIPGMVMMWSKPSGDLPKGWVACNGSAWTRVGGQITNTPDLRDRFVKGAVDQADIETTASGGLHTPNGSPIIIIPSQDVVVAKHVLDITEIPPHTHTYDRYQDRARAGSGSSYPTRYLETESSSIGGGLGHDHLASTIEATLSIEPEYYILMYIIFVGADATETTPPGTFLPTPTPPVADFDITTALLLATFDASPSEDPSGTIVTWDWVFGDGQTDTGEVSSITFATEGTYSVRLTVTSTTGLQSVSNQFVTVQA
jgi:hypothetical protein